MIHAVQRPKAIERLLNRKLDTLINYLEQNQWFVTNYRTWGPNEKIKQIHQITRKKMILKVKVMWSIVIGDALSFYRQFQINSNFAKIEN